MGFTDIVLRLLGKKRELRCILAVLPPPISHPHMYPSAIKYAKRALELISPTDETDLYFEVLAKLGHYLRRNQEGSQADQIEEAIACFDEVLAQWSKTDDGPKSLVEFVHVKGGLAHCYMYRQYGSRAENLETFIQIIEDLTLLTQKYDLFEISRFDLSNNLAGGYALRMRGDRLENCERALQVVAPHCEWALELMRTDADTVIMRKPKDGSPCENLCVLGNHYLRRRRGNPATNREIAIECLEFAYAIAVRHKELLPRLLAFSVTLLLIAYRDHPFRTPAHLHRAGELVHEASSIWSHEFRDISGQLLVEAGRTWLEVTDIANDTPGLDFAALDKRRAMSIEQSIACYKLALNIAEKRDYAICDQAKLGLARSYESRIAFGSDQENREKAIQLYREVLKAAGSRVNPIQRLTATVEFANFYFRLKEFARAEELYRNAVTMAERQARTAFSFSGRRAELAEIGDLYTNLAYCAFIRGSFEEALDTIESGKNQILLRTLSEDNADLSEMPPEDAEQIINLRQLVRELTNQLEFYDIDYDQHNTPAHLYQETATRLQASIEELHALLESPRCAMPQPDWRQGLEALPRNTMVLTPLICEHGTAVILVSVDKYGLQSVSGLNIPGFTIGHLADTLQKNLWKGTAIGWNRAEYDETEEAIATALLEPLLEHVINFEHVVFALSGGCQLLPLNAFYLAQQGGKQCLADKFEARYVPSLSILEFLKVESEYQHTALLVATSDVPGGIHEVKAVEQVMITHGIKTTVLIDDQATRANVLQAMSQSTYLHFACHGLFAWGENPLKSQLKLWGKDVLTVGDLTSGSKLRHTRLAVLAACETGVVESAKSTNEFIGLTTAFLQAGAAGVISALWKVDGRSTALLMEKVYENLLSESVPPATALKNAQMWLRTFSAQDTTITTTMEMNDAGTQSPTRGVSRQNCRPPYDHGLYWGGFTYHGL